MNPSPSNNTLSVLCPIIVLSVAFFTYCLHLGEPNLLFWDENYHVPAASRYLANIAQFEGHPPLGKLLIAAGDYLVGVNRQSAWQTLARYKQISDGQLPADFNLAGMRIMPALFGLLTAILVYGLMLSLSRQKPVVALLFTSLYVFENAYIVHFRGAHLDSFQLFFSVAALWLFVDAWQAAKPLSWKTYAALATFIALAMMVKVNAVLLLVMLPILYARELSMSPSARYASMPFTVTGDNGLRGKWYAMRALLSDFAKKALAAAFSGLLVCAVVFGIHLSLGRNLPDSKTPAGDEDIANMSPSYGLFLEGHGNLTPTVFAAAAQDYFAFMQKSHLGVPKLNVCKVGENGSSPWIWPLMSKTINYRWDKNNDLTGYLQLVGNPVSWCLGFLAVLSSFSLVISHRLFAAPIHHQELYRLIEVFCGFYAVYMGLHVVLANQRVMYLYHYFLGLFISYLLWVLVWQYLEHARPLLQRYRYGLLTAMALSIVGGYAFTAPLTYHQPLSKPACELRNIIKPVVQCQ